MGDPTYREHRPGRANRVTDQPGIPSDAYTQRREDDCYAAYAADAADLLNDVWTALPADLRVAAALIEPHSPDPLRTPPLSTS